jgi:hypothetical protein
MVSGGLCSAQNHRPDAYEFVLPKDFPEIPSEGAPQSAWDAYKRAKDDWMLKNPERYQQLANKPHIYSEDQQKAIRAKKEEEVFRKDTLPHRGGVRP